MDCEALRKAYEVIYRGQVLTMKQWVPARDLLRAFADRAVRNAAGRHKIPHRTWPELIEDVEGEIVEKVIKKTLGDPAAIKNLEALMCTVTYRATITVLRRIKSPLAGALVADPGSAAAAPRSDEVEDVFLEVRRRMDAFRLPEHRLARDALLAVRLATETFPGPAFLREMVPVPMRVLCYNAAVFDINTAILGITGDVRSAQTAA